MKDYFVPGFTLGTIWSATPNIDVAGWYKWSDAIKATGDVGTAANFYTKQNASGDSKNVRYGDTIFDDCGAGTTAAIANKPCGSGDNGHVKFNIPMEAKLGFRYHKPRSQPLPEPAAPPPAPILTRPGQTTDPLLAAVKRGDMAAFRELRAAERALAVTYRLVGL